MESLAQAASFGTIQENATPGLPGDVGGVISKLLPYIFSLAGILLLVYLILGGLQLMTSRGDPKAIEAAQAKITNALIGFVIIIIAFFVVQLLGQLLGLQSNEAFKNTFGLK